MSNKILVPIAQGTEEMEAVIIIDLMRRAGFKVIVAAENEIITCSRGIKIIPDVLFDDIAQDNDFDVIILPGGIQGAEYLRNNNMLEEIIKKHHEKSGLFGAICAAPIILSNHKVINENTRVTSHPSVKSQLLHHDYIEDNVVQDGNVITSRGAGTAIEFVLKIIEVLSGKEKAIQIADSIIFRFDDIIIEN